jgi:N-acetylmuramidase
MSDGFFRSYTGWNGQFVHPNSSAGAGGPGNFRNVGLLGQWGDLDLLLRAQHPMSPRTLQCTANDRPPTAAPEPDLGFLFTQCLNPTRGLGVDDYNSAATALGVDAASVMAVAEVETSGAAFDDLGRPRILFERHYFHKATGGKFAAKHPTISAKSGGGYGKFSAQYGKLQEAYELDKDAALGSASWGRFQIMGSNYKAAGFRSVRAFVKAMTQSEADHLRAFVSFVAADARMKKALQDRDWAAFAKAYNGKGYAKNKYDEKLAAAYKKFAPPPPPPPPRASPPGTPAAAVRPGRMP